MNDLTTTQPEPLTSLAQHIGSDGSGLTDLQVAEAFALSGFFGPTRNVPAPIQQAAQAFVRIQAGKELGVGPVASMTGINIISGKPEIGAKLLAALIRRSDRYDYTIPTLTNDTCTVVIHDNKLDERTEISHTMEDAKRAKLDRKDNYLKHPRNMLFARAISTAANTVCPDVGCMPLYGSGELTEDSEPDAIEATLAPDERGDAWEAEPVEATVIDTQGVRSALGEAVRHATEGVPLPEPEPVVRSDQDLAADGLMPNGPVTLAELGAPYLRWVQRWGHVAAVACPDCRAPASKVCRTKSGSIASKAHRGRLLASSFDPLRSPAEEPAEPSAAPEEAPAPDAGAHRDRLEDLLGESNIHLVDELSGTGDLTTTAARALYGLTVDRAGASEAMSVWKAQGVALRPGVVIPRAVARAVLESLPTNGS